MCRPPSRRNPPLLPTVGTKAGPADPGFGTNDPVRTPRSGWAVRFSGGGERVPVHLGPVMGPPDRGPPRVPPHRGAE